MNPLARLPRLPRPGLPTLPGLSSLPGPSSLPGSELVIDLGVYALFLGRRTEAYAGLVALARPGRGDTVVDVGSGTGYLATLLAARVSPGGVVIGVDPSRSAVERAQRQAVPACRFEVGSALSMPLHDGEADLVMSSLLIHHIEPGERQAAMLEMGRVLRPGGRLFVADLKRIDNPVLSAGAGAIISCFRAALTESALLELVARGGFRIERAGVYWDRVRYVVAVRD